MCAGTGRGFLKRRARDGSRRLSVGTDRWSTSRCTDHHDITTSSSTSRREESFRRAWPILLHQRLPVIRIPLSSGDDDAPLDLQAVLARTYDSADYENEIDYCQPPRPTLSEEHKQWAEAILGQFRDGNRE